MQSDEDNFRIRIIRNSNKDFYSLIGSFLSKREIVNEIGSNIWDDNNKVWIVGIDNNIVIGFCAFYHKKNKTYFCSDYVLPLYRNQSIYNKLFSKRMDINKNEHCIATTTNKSLNTFKRYNFKEVRKIGKYTVVERRP